jgi:predicted metal-dependent phosphoesterase TrpH
MTQALLQQHWALVVGSIVGGAALTFAAWRAWLDSPRGRLAAARRRLRSAWLEARRRQQALQQLSARLAGLQKKAESVKPRRLEETAGAVQDAEALLKIAGDQVLVAENHVRKIIVEEFPPKRHDRMRSRYLPRERTDGKPFSF